MRGRRSKPGARLVAGGAVAASTPAFPVVQVSAAIMALVLLAYSNSFQGELVRDAAGLIQADPRIREVSVENLGRIWTGEYWFVPGAAPLYRPVTTSTFLVNYAVLGHGERPWGYHLVNLLLHGANAALVFALLWRLLLPLPAALVAAGVFALHPVATEAVTNIAGCADLLAAAAILAGLLLHVVGPGRRPWLWRMSLFVIAAAGLLSKENAVVLVAMAALYDGLVRRRWSRESYVVLALAYAVAFAMRHLALADSVWVHDPLVDNPLRGLSFLAARLTALKVMGAQLGLLVWPLALSADYSYDHVPLFPAGGFDEHLKLAASIVTLAVLLAVAILLRRREPRLAFLSAFLVVALLPTSNLLVLIGTIRADRFLYVPSVAFAGAAGWLLYVWALDASRTPIGGARVRALMAVAAVLVVAGSWTALRNEHWRNDETLFRAARRVSPRSYRVHKGLAQAILAGTPSDARLDEAVVSATEAVRILESGTLPVGERSADTFVVLGLAHKMKADRAVQQSREPEAVAEYERARGVLERAVVIDRAANAGARTPTGHARLYDVLGNVCLRMGDVDCSLEQFAHVRLISPDRSVSYMLSAWALVQKGRLDEAAVMTLQAWLIDARPDALDILREIYRQIDPELTAVGPDGLLRLEPPVRAHLEQACRLQGARTHGRCETLGIKQP